ncbi:hypothetical protein Taro_032978 [Colocasia esculenta]|uniref:SKP1-like protein 21 n=1 Tax=Colocasia esculenta TaxID=4460 RepID=A0A843WB41_COLES|nr:hypothetical protein [Colocasia esculenta]
MSHGEMAIVKPEAMKSYIWLQTSDGSIQQVEEEVAMFCPMICREILQTGMGTSKNYAIALPQRVNAAILSLILDYCQFHQVPGRSNKERKSFDEKFIRIDTKRLCELTSAADSLQLKPLVDLTSRALARMIEGKTPEEIREIFHLPDDLTEEEKLEPLRNTTDDPRIRLLNRLYAKKRKELKERQKLKVLEDTEIEEQRVEEHVDDRSVDDLLSFINGGNGDSKGARVAKHKKKNRRRKDQSKNSSNNFSQNHKQEEATSTMPYEGGGDYASSPGRSSRPQDFGDVKFVQRDAFEDAEIDDEFDPAMKEELDRSQAGGGLKEVSSGVRAQAALLAGLPREAVSGDSAWQAPKSYADVLRGVDGSVEVLGRSGRVVEAGVPSKQKLEELTGAGWEIVRVAVKLLLGVGSSEEEVEKAVEEAFFVVEGAFIGVRQWSSNLGELSASTVAGYDGEKLVFRLLVLHEESKPLPPAPLGQPSLRLEVEEGAWAGDSKSNRPVFCSIPRLARF